MEAARFGVPAAAYDRYMGRFAAPLAPRVAGFARGAPGRRVPPVGWARGALTAELARRTGAERVAAADPAEQFARACAARVPGADVRTAPAERLPFDEGGFDATLAQLVVSFMTDAPAGLREMRRVARPGATVAACTWEASGHGMLNLVWEAAEPLTGPARANTEARLRYRTEAELLALAEQAGVRDVELERLTVEGAYEGFEDFWGAIETAA